MCLPVSNSSDRGGGGYGRQKRKPADGAFGPLYGIKNGEEGEKTPEAFTDLWLFGIAPPASFFVWNQYQADGADCGGKYPLHRGRADFADFYKGQRFEYFLCPLSKPVRGAERYPFCGEISGKGDGASLCADYRLLKKRGGLY